MKVEFKSVDDYIGSLPQEIQSTLTDIRNTILQNAPDAIESISYGMPAYKLNGQPLVYFAGYKNHIGFYATPTGHTEFKEELSIYKQGKGSVQFPPDAVPLALIKRIVEFRISETKLKSAK